MRRSPATAGESHEPSAQFEIAFDPATPEQLQAVLDRANPANGGAWKDIVYFWTQTNETGIDDADSGKLEAAVEDGLYPLFDLARRLARHRAGQPPRLRVVTRAVHRIGDDKSCRIGASPLWGFCRVLNLEAPHLICQRIDLAEAEDIEGEVRSLRHEMSLADREDQVAYRGGVRHVARLMRGVDSALQSDETVLAGGVEPYRLVGSERGVVDDLAFRPMTRVKPLAGEIEIAVQATGINFRDVLNVLNLYPGDPGPLGLECSGVVTRVGPGVENFKPGDRVVAIGLACFSQFVIAEARLAAQLPAQISFEEGAGVPIVFATAAYGLQTLAGLRAGETLLVHSAAGGVGHAAIEVARQVGAKIVATAGSEEKREYLRAKGVEHVFDSRSPKFAEDVLAVTEGKGVDVVLNFLPGEAIAENLKALATNGRFVEIGKIDIWEENKVAAVRPDVAYHILALDTLAIHQPAVVGESLRGVMEAIERGDYRPAPARSFELAEVHEAFRFMAAAKHIGKIVLRHPETDSAGGDVGLDTQGTWLLTGGLGALGLRTARALADQGAKRIVLAGRREPDAAMQTTLDEMRAVGCQVETFVADVARREDVDRLVQFCDAGEAPLAGVIHLAGVLDDGVIDNLSRPRFDAVLRPKCLGALNLHLATRHRKLDAFVLFSSAASLLGSPGQANYAAANAFLDALAHARRAAGLKAVSVNWGPWAEAGMAVRAKGDVHQQWELMGLTPIAPDDGAAIVEMLVEEDAIQAGVLPINWQRLLGRFPPGAEPAVLAALAGERRNRAEPSKEWLELVAKIEEAPPAERVDLLVAYMQQSAASLLGFDQSQKVDPHTPLNELGFDSLMAVEMANKFTSASGAALPVTLLFDHPTLHAMAGYMLREVLKLESGEAAPPPVRREEPQSVESLTESLLEQIDRLSDEQVREQIG